MSSAYPLVHYIKLQNSALHPTPLYTMQTKCFLQLCRKTMQFSKLYFSHMCMRHRGAPFECFDCQNICRSPNTVFGPGRALRDAASFPLVYGEFAVIKDRKEKLKNTQEQNKADCSLEKLFSSLSFEDISPGLFRPVPVA